MFRSACNFWSKKYHLVDPVYLDVSKPIAFHGELLNFHKAANDAVVGFGRNKYNFKLSIGEIILVNSADYIQIQLADLLVSSVNHAAKKILDDEEDDFSKMLFSSALYEKSTSAAMWPSHNVTFTAIGK